MFSSRYDHLKLVFAGLQRSGIPLIEFTGTEYVPALFADDIGMYILIPKLALWLNVSLDTAITIFFGGITISAAIVGLWGFFSIYQSWKQRTVALLGVLSLASTIHHATTDVYCVPAALAIAGIPWAMYFFYYNKGTKQRCYIFLFLAGVASGVTHFIRSYGCGSLLLFTVTLICFSWNAVKKERLFALLSLLMGLGVPWYYFHACLQQYAAFVHTNMPHHDNATMFHPFWHNIYIGLGFITNNFGLRYDDSVAFTKALSLRPELIKNNFSTGFSYDASYDAVLRQEVFDLIQRYPFYFLELIFAKLGVIFLFFLRYANVGLLILFITPLSNTLLFAFLVGLGWGALPGILAVPSIAAYLLNLIVFAGILNIVSINNFLNIGDFPSLRGKLSTAHLKALWNRGSL